MGIGQLAYSTIAFMDPVSGPSLASAVFHVDSVDEDPSKVLAQVRDGVDATAIETLMDALGVTQQEIARLLGTSLRTVARLRGGKGRMDLRASDRAARLVRVFDRAVEVLGNIERARLWLATPNQALAGNAPRLWLDTDAGTTEVTSLLGRIEHGIFS